MPELPEVETVASGMRTSILGLRIVRIETFRADLRRPIPDLKRFEGCTIREIGRRAKYLALKFDGCADRLYIHLGMSGRITISQPKPRLKHDHVVFHLDDGQEVIFNDARRFGQIIINKEPELFGHLGPEPLSDDFDASYLADKLKGRTGSIKTSIMNQELVVGVGNIYASEALWRCGISPKRAAGKVSRKRLAELVVCIRQVLEEAIASGGSTLRDYVRSSGDLGYFQHQFTVYGRDGQACKRCRTPIQRIVQQNRSTYYCPCCQR